MGKHLTSSGFPKIDGTLQYTSKKDKTSGFWDTNYNEKPGCTTCTRLMSLENAQKTNSF